MNFQPRLSFRLVGRSYPQLLILTAFFCCCAIESARAANSIIAWGNNNNLQSQVPIGLTNATALDGGTIHSLAIKPDGTVAGWGDNLFGQTDVTDLANVMAISAGDTFSLFLLSNATVVVRGNQTAPPSDLTNVIAIAAGWRHCLALKQDGTVVSWGDTNSVPAGLTSVIAIAAGDGQSLALLANRTVVAWGDTNFNKTVIPPGLSNVVAIAAGKDHCVALQANGRVAAWGANAEGQASVPPGLSNIVAVTAGAFHTVALRANGSLAAWGNNTYGQSDVAAWTGFFQVAAGGQHNLGQVGDGSPFITLPPRTQRVPVSEAATFTVLAAGAQPMMYQWRKNGTNLVGRTNSQLVLSNIQLGDAGDYSVHIANSNGTASASATLIPFHEPPVVVVQPADITIAFGEDPIFSVTATGSKPLRYQWWFGNAPIDGATNRNLQLTDVLPAQAGGYSVVITNLGGSTTSVVANLIVVVGPPIITSSLSATGVQGNPFFYQIVATNYPIRFAAPYLPLALSLDTNSGIISGIPIEPGTFTPTITAINDYGPASETLTITIGSGVPSITSPLTVVGNENQDLTYQITITGSGVGVTFGAQNLPGGLLLNPVTGLVSGKPAIAGTFTSTISASNNWGVTAATLQFNINYPTISGIALGDLTYTYHAPYLLDFEFTLRDTDGQGIVVPPALLKALCMENTHPGTTLVIHPDDAPRLPTATTLFTNVISETGVFITRSGGSTGGKVTKSYLVLDYTASVSDPALNGDSNGDGISDAVDYMVSGAHYFVNQQSAAAQVGVFEFHRDDEDPNQVLALTRDKELLNEAIAGIWTNYINWFYAGSRTWDAVDAAVLAFGAANADEQRSVIFISDGLPDTSSSATVDQIITDAQDAGVRVYCIAFGTNPDTNTLGRITSSTGGRLLLALSKEELFGDFAQITKDVQARYVLRWHSLRRDTNEVAPFFLISYQGFTNAPAVWTWGNNNDYVTNSIELYTTNLVEDIDTSVQPPVTNLVEEIETNNVDEITALWSNPDLGPYVATNYVGTVTEGSLRLVVDEEVTPTGISLRATYIPRFVRQLRLRYRPNWPCTVSLSATNLGEMLYGWSLIESNNADGSKALLLSSPNPQSTTTNLPFPGFGPLLRFTFKDLLGSPAEAFALMEVDNSIYTNIIAGGQRFVFEAGNVTNFVTSLPALAQGTPIPWLKAHGISGNFAAAELADQDGDRVPTWQEYQANTNPTNATSVFVLRGLSNDIYGRYQITFSTSINRRYRVESSIDLINWETVEEDIAGVDADVTVLDHRYQPWLMSVFYRAVVY